MSAQTIKSAINQINLVAPAKMNNKANTPTLVSVIIPVYNAEKTVGNILKKLITQNYHNIEIIAVNDGSIDNSWKILQTFAKKDKRIIVINQTNAGASAARNAGIKKATGEYVTFIDSDDDISNELILELANQAQDKSDFIMCGMSINGKKIVAPDIYIENKNLIAQYTLRSLLTKNLLYGPCCKLFRLSVIADNKIQFPENIKYGEDTIFVLNYLRYVRNMTNIQQSLYAYHIQPSGLASTNNTNIAFRKARVDALNMFMRDGSFSLRSMCLYLVLRLRWLLAFVKCTLRN